MLYSVLLTWVLVALIFVVPVVLRLYAGDEPRNSEPDSEGEDDPRLARLPLAA